MLWHYLEYANVIIFKAHYLEKTRIENHAILNWDDVNMHFRHAGEKALKEFQYIA